MERLGSWSQEHWFVKLRVVLNDLNKKRAGLFTGIGLVLGLLIFVGLRMALVQDHHTHYHANFALYVNGQQDKFDNFTFYEEVQSCSSDDKNNPKTRAHMHNQVNDVVHVHDDNATWGHFFANLGYGLLDDAVQTNKGIFTNGVDGKALTFILNGKAVESIANRVIQSEDTLLIDYGDNADTQERYKQIKHTAHEANVKPDPASCSGSHELTLKDRLKRAVNFRN